MPFSSPGDLLDPGIKPGSPALQADSLPSEPPGKPHVNLYLSQNVKCIVKRVTRSPYSWVPFSLEPGTVFLSGQSEAKFILAPSSRYV